MNGDHSDKVYNCVDQSNIFNMRGNTAFKEELKRLKYVFI